MRKIKVLQFISSTGMYGAEYWVLALIKNLDSVKTQSYVAAPIDSANQVVDLLGISEGLGFPARAIRMRGKLSPDGIVRLYKVLKKEKIDIIHTHGYKSNIMGLFAAKMAGIKSVNTPHGFEDVKNDNKMKAYRYLDRTAYKFFDSVAPLSEVLYSVMLKYKVDPGKINLIMNGIDLDAIETERRNPGVIEKSGNEKIIGYIGRLIPHKNIYDILKAFDGIVGQHKSKNLRLAIVGDGPEKGALEQYAGSLKSASFITFFGYRSDRLNLLKSMDIFTMTSRREGMPRCMMEAIVMGIPVAAYNVQGVNQLLIDNQTGLMADFGNVEGLQKCWLRLLSDDGLAKKMAENGKRYIEDNFSAKRMADEYFNLYYKLLENS